MYTQNHKTILLTFILFIFSNCYFNPIVNGLLNPVEEENNNSFLGLLGLAQGTSSLMITGQIRNPNGVAMVGLGLTPSATANNIKSTSPYTTDDGGRFYLPHQSGRISFDVSQNGSPFFTLVLNVLNPNGITAETIGAPAGLEISNLGTIDPTNPPSFFELVRVYIIQGDDPPMEINLHNANANNVNYLYLVFSESPEPISMDEGAVESWVASNITITPTINLEPINSENTTGNTRSLGYSFPFGMDTLYSIAFGSGIKSASGKSLTPRSVVFCMEPNVNCGF